MNTNIRSFVPLQKLGEGSFASVYKVKRISDNKTYALKKIKMNQLSQKAKQNSLNEVRLLASLNSPYIVRYYEAFFDQTTQSLCIIMEYAEEGDLRKKIENTKKHKKITPEIEIWKVLIHLLHGLKMLHQSKILHRDLKCENIMISQSIYKIGDMNVSIINKNGLVDTQTGTPYYASPEVWKDEPYNQKSDIWSLGCIIYELAALRPPFIGNSLNDLYKNVMRGTYHSLPKIYSNELCDIINRCLKLSPAERPSAQDLLENFTLKMYENICLEYKLKNQDQNVQLLKTIMMPKNMKQLNKYLPESTYHLTHNQISNKKSNNSLSLQNKDKQRKLEINNIIKCQPNELTPINQAAKLNQKQVYINKVEINNEKFSIKKQSLNFQQKQINHPLQKQTDKSKQSQNINHIDNIQSFKKQNSSSEQIPQSISNPQIIKVNNEKNNLKSLEQIQSFNRLIERIKSSAKQPQTTKKQHKKSKRTLKQINNKIPIIKKSRSKSIKRTERSMSRNSSKDSIKIQKYTSRKLQPRRGQINCYSERPNSSHTDHENQTTKNKDYLNIDKSNKYSTILLQAKQVLSNHLKKHKHIF